MNLKIRIISVFLAFFLLSESLLQASEGVIKPINFESGNEEKQIALKWAQENLPALSESIATIEDAWKAKRGNGNNKIIYLIQDAHTNPSGQLNLSRVLDILLKHENAQSGDDAFPVFIEAGSGDVSLSFLRKYGDISGRKQIASKYLKQGLLHGEEYLDLISEHNFFIWGVEDMALYQKGIERYRYVARNRNKFQDYLKRIQQTLDTIEPRLLNPALLAFLEKEKKVYQEELSLTDYFETLQNQAKALNISIKDYPHLRRLCSLRLEESQIDFKKANFEQQKAITSLSAEDQKELLTRQIPGKLGYPGHQELQGFYSFLEEKIKNSSVSFPNLKKYFAYLKESQKIDPAKILDEQKFLEEKILDSLSVSHDEKIFIQCVKTLRFLTKLFNLTLTPEEYGEYKQINRRFTIAHLTGFLNKKIVEYQSYYERAIFLESGYDEIGWQAQDFYELTYRRDQKFIENMLSKLNRSDKAALIAGGFHTPNLKQLLKKQNISYISLTPQVTQETNQARYEELLLRQKLSPDNIFSPAHTCVSQTSRLAPAGNNIVFGAQLIREVQNLGEDTALSTKPEFNTVIKKAQGARLVVERVELQGEADIRAVLNGKSAKAYDEQVTRQPWYLKNFEYVMDLFARTGYLSELKNKRRPIVIADASTGTGFGIRELQKYLKLHEVPVDEAVIADVGFDLASEYIRYAVASLTSSNMAVHAFILPFEKPNGYALFTEAMQAQGGKKVDLGVLLNAAHLIASSGENQGELEKGFAKLERSYKGLFDGTTDGGIWLIGSAGMDFQRPESAILLDQLFENVHKEVLALVKTDPLYSDISQQIIQASEENEAIKNRKNFLPKPFTVEQQIEALEIVGFEVVGNDSKINGNIPAEQLRAFVLGVDGYASMFFSYLYKAVGSNQADEILHKAFDSYFKKAGGSVDISWTSLVARKPVKEMLEGTDGARLAERTEDFGYGQIRTSENLVILVAHAKDQPRAIFVDKGDFRRNIQTAILELFSLKSKFVKGDKDALNIQFKKGKGWIRANYKDITSLAQALEDALSSDPSEITKQLLYTLRRMNLLNHFTGGLNDAQSPKKLLAVLGESLKRKIRMEINRTSKDMPLRQAKKLKELIHESNSEIDQKIEAAITFKPNNRLDISALIKVLFSIKKIYKDTLIAGRHDGARLIEEASPADVLIGRNNDEMGNQDQILIDVPLRAASESKGARLFQDTRVNASQGLQALFNSPSIASRVLEGKPVYIVVWEEGETAPSLYRLTKLEGGLVAEEKIYSMDQVEGFSFLGVYDEKDREGTLSRFWEQRRAQVEKAFLDHGEKATLEDIGLTTRVFRQVIQDRTTHELPASLLEKQILTESELDAADRWNGKEQAAALLDIAALFESRANRKNDSSLFVILNIDEIQDAVVKNFIQELMRDKIYSAYFFEASQNKEAVKIQVHSGPYDPANVSKDRIHISIAQVSPGELAPWAKALNLNQLTAVILQTGGLIGEEGQLTTQELSKIEEAIRNYRSDLGKYFEEFDVNDFARYLTGQGKSELFILKAINIAYQLQTAVMGARLITRSA